MNLKYSLTTIFILCFLGAALAQKDKHSKQNFYLITQKALSPEDSSLVEQLYYSGLREKVAQNNTLAIDYFKRVVEMDAANYNAYYELAQIYFYGKDLPNAKTFIEKAITIKADNEWYWLLSANIYEEQKDYKLLSYALQELVKIAPYKIEFNLDHANTLQLLGKKDEALKVYETLEKKIGLTDEIVLGRQRIFLSKNDVNSAGADLETLIKNDPSEIRNYILLGDLYFNNNLKEKALEVYLKAKELDADNPYIRLAVADIYNAQGKGEEAFNELKIAFEQQDLNIDQKVKIIVTYFQSFPELRAVRYAEGLSKILTEIHPDDPKSFSVYGDVLFQKNELIKAKAAYEKALSLNKQVYAVWDQLIRIKLSLNDMEGVVENGEEALTFFPNQYVLYLYTALGYNQLKKSEKAITYLNTVLNYEIDNEAFKAQVYSGLGDAYQALRKYKESAEAYEKCLAIQPDNVYALNNYAYYLSLRNEQLEKAEKMSLHSNELEKDNSSFQDTYAWILFRLKKYKEAKVWIEKAVKSSSNKSAVIIEHYGDILYHVGEQSQAIINWKKALEMGEKSATLQKKINEKKYLE